jgi:acetyl esterase/lipase
MRSLLISLLLIGTQLVIGQNSILPLWQEIPPNYREAGEKEKSEKNGIEVISLVQNPDIAVYLPSKPNATGQAVVICPGGGYHILAYDWEGTDIAKWLNSIGVAGIVLKYRLPDAKCNIVSYKSPLLDAQRAIRMARYHAKEWNINPQKVGVMGFSAGGHLASTAGTRFDSGNPDSDDPVEKLSCRPDFMILGYPVISMDESVTHKGSKRNLLGPDPTPELVEEFSNELQVSEETPPTFLFLASDDKVVVPENSIRFYQALIKNKVPAEIHIYPEGGHGFSLAVNKPHVSKWSSDCAAWLKWINKSRK